MGLLDGLINELKYNFSEKPEWKGQRFEDFVIDSFDEKYFHIIEATHLFTGKKGERYVESSLNPDFTLEYRHKNKKERFAIECKFRSDLYQGMLKWSYPDQLKRYRQFEKDRNIPVFVVVGLGGDDDDPENMYVIPLKEAKYPSLYPSVYQKYSKDPKKDFFWKDGVLK